MRRVAVPLAVWVAGIVLASAIDPVRASEHPEHVGRGIVRDDDRLILANPAGDVAVPLDGAQPMPDPPAGLVVLRRDAGAGEELRLLDRRGRALGTIAVPAGWTGFATDAGVVLVPDAPHEARRPHWIKFLSHAGERRAEVRQDVMLLDWTVAPGGALATVNEPRDGAATRLIIAYDPHGAETWRYTVSNGVATPAAVMTPGGQLVVLERDLDARVSTVTMLARGHAPKSYRISNVTQLVADPGSSHVAAVGQDVVALFDARTQKLSWRRDEHLDFVLHGGLRFDARGGRLLVVHAERRRAEGSADLQLRSYRITDGGSDHATLGSAPLAEMPRVIDVETPPAGGRRVVLHDRIVTAVPDAAQ